MRAIYDLLGYSKETKPTMVFDRVYSFLYNFKNGLSNKNILIAQGGTWSSKTVSICENLFLYALMNPRKYILITSGDVTQIETDAKIALDNIIMKSPFSSLVRYTSNPKKYIFKNGTEIRLNAFRNLNDAEGSKYDVVYCSEVKRMKYPIFRALSFRFRDVMMMDYNPTSRFYVHDLIDDPKTDFFISNYKHNQYANKTLIYDQILSKKEIAPNFYKAYGLGLTGSVEGVIYKNVFEVDTFPDFLPEAVYGIDYGYNDPFVLLKIHILEEERKAYIEELAYIAKAELNDLYQIFEGIDYLNPFTSIIGDNGARAIYNDISSKFDINVRSVGEKNVSKDLLYLSDFTIYVKKGSKGTFIDFRDYKVKDGINNPNGLIVPDHTNSHAPDAFRYGVKYSVGNRKMILH